MRSRGVEGSGCQTQCQTLHESSSMKIQGGDHSNHQKMTIDYPNTDFSSHTADNTTDHSHGMVLRPTTGHVIGHSSHVTHSIHTNLINGHSLPDHSSHKKMVNTSSNIHMNMSNGHFRARIDDYRHILSNSDMEHALKFIRYSDTRPPQIRYFQWIGAEAVRKLTDWLVAKNGLLWNTVRQLVNLLKILIPFVSPVHPDDQSDDTPWWSQLSAYATYVMLFVLAYTGHSFYLLGLGNAFDRQERISQKNFVKLYSDFEDFYNRNFYGWVRDCFHRPICSSPGPTFTLVDRVTYDFGWTYRYLGTTTETVNLASYNYLGFGQNTSPCIKDVVESIAVFGINSCSCQHESGNQSIHRELERTTAEYLGMEDAICFPAGFSTNTMNIPCFVSKGCLILSDELNHASLILGCRLSGATIWIFKHNDMKDLEAKLVKAISRRDERFRKILICVEGIYSMEGTIVNLPVVIALKKRYKAYLYLDEAHSMGAVGSTGRGVCEYYGCSPDDVDISVGTFSKSFASAGGYVAGRKAIIDHLRVHSHNSSYGRGISAPIAQHVISIMKSLMSTKGNSRVRQLRRNVIYIRRRLQQLGFVVRGDLDAPIVLVMIPNPVTIFTFSRELLSREVAVAVVGFPATPLTGERVRICISSAHTKDILDKAIQAFDIVGDKLGVKVGWKKYSEKGFKIDY